MGKTRRTGDLVTDNNLYVNPTDDSFHVGTGITMYGGSVGIISCTGIFIEGSSVSASASVVDDTNPRLGGTLETNGNTIDFGDSSGATDDRLRFGAGQDLQIWHNGSNSYITQYSDVGDLYLNCHNDDNDVIIQTDNGSGSTADYFRADGSTGESLLYHYGSEKLATKSNGIDVTGHTETDTLSVSGISTFQSHVKLGDNSNLKIGAGDDLEFYHNSITNESIIKETGGSNFLIQGTNLYLQSASGENFFVGTLDGSAELYYDNSKKFETTGAGVTITGVCTATSFVKSGGTSSEFLMADGSTSTGGGGGVTTGKAIAMAMVFG